MEIKIRSMKGTMEDLVEYMEAQYGMPHTQGDGVVAWHVGNNASHSFYLGINKDNKLVRASYGEVGVDEDGWPICDWSEWKEIKEIEPGVYDTGYIGR